MLYTFEKDSRLLKMQILSTSSKSVLLLSYNRLNRSEVLSFRQCLQSYSIMVRQNKTSLIS